MSDAENRDTPWPVLPPHEQWRETCEALHRWSQIVGKYRLALLAFLQSTYQAAAVAGRWDRAALECALGRPEIPRPLEGASSP